MEAVSNGNQVQNNYQVTEKKSKRNTKIDMSVPADEVKISSKAKKGAKIGAVAGAAYGICGLAYGIKKGDFSLITKGLSKTKMAAFSVGCILGASIWSALGAGTGAIIGKVSDAVSAKKNN